MQSMNEITTGMTPQEEELIQAMFEEKEAYRRAYEKVHKQILIEQILKDRPGVFTREQLTRRGLSFLERIA